jgi:Protein of unknown function (DUF3048) N-terminal domain/Protein of unknown function (DUF3048) C-terminal domain
MRRALVSALAVVAVAVGLAVVMLAAGIGRAASPTLDPSQVAGPASPPPTPNERPVVTPTETPTETPVPTPTPSPTPVPTPTPVPAPLTGRLVPPAVAAQHPIAVMIDDHPDARPQAGFNAASIVWQAPAEGGIPRYMLVFQDTVPTDVGPVRSARYYYIAWAAEWRAVYAHSGGSPQALQTLRQKGSGQLVYNADEFRWGGSFHRVHTDGRFPPHNLFTDGKHLRKLAKSLEAADKPMKAAWRFAPDLASIYRPRGGRIEVAYAYNKIRYDYDWKTNTYLRSVTSGKQIDFADGKRVAPKNVVIMLMQFGPLNDGSKKHRLEAEVIGSGTAWIATNGTTIKGKWRKTGLTKPTQFFDADGKPVTLTVGQTFVQVMQTGTKVTIAKGAPPPPPDPRSPYGSAE